jgi:hypothetical protein
VDPVHSRRAVQDGAFNLKQEAVCKTGAKRYLDRRLTRYSFCERSDELAKVRRDALALGGGELLDGIEQSVTMVEERAALDRGLWLKHR